MIETSSENSAPLLAFGGCTAMSVLPKYCNVIGIWNVFVHQIREREFVLNHFRNRRFHMGAIFSFLAGIVLGVVGFYVVVCGGYLLLGRLFGGGASITLSPDESQKYWSNK